MNSKLLESPKKGASIKEKLDFYDHLMQEGDLTLDQLKVLRQRLYKIDTYFQDTEVVMNKITLLDCVNELIQEGK